MKFSKNLPLLLRLSVAVALLLSVWQLTAQTLPPDAYLYYRRTHGGALPGPGVNPSNHSGETTNITTKVAARIQPSGKVRSLTLLDNGVDPANLGKGDWIWQLPTCTNQLGGYIPAVTDLQSLISWETNHGMQWITVKCGDGGSVWSQFDANLVATAHNAGLKIFGWAYAYGNDVPGEINVALNALNLGADGFIIDAESEYETVANNSAKATQYASTIKADYPTRFLAHAPFPIISVHSGFPYVAFGTYCDAVMPQAYWAAIGGTNYAVTMVTRMNTEWRNWQNSLTGAATNAIKPIVPIGEGYNSGSDLVDGTQIAAFVNALYTNTPPATAGGYHGLSWWSCQHHGASPDKWPAIGAYYLGTNTSPTYFLTQPLSRVVDAGNSVSLSVSAYDATGYQWQRNGTNLPGGTGSTLTFAPAQLTNAGSYTCVISNAFNSVTSSVATLTVYPVQTTVFADPFDSNTAGNWTVNQSSADNSVTFSYDYSPLGIPSAPHSAGGTTRGLQMQANLSQGVVSAISLSPNGQSFPGDYRLHFDMWINVNGPFPGGGSGSTEFLTAGIGTAGNGVEWTGNGTADGFYFSADGEGGVSDTSTTTGDYCAYSGASLLSPSTGDYVAGTATTARGNNSPYYLTAFPVGMSAPPLQQINYSQQSGTLYSGTVGLAWHDVIVSRRGNTVDWSIDGIRIATISNAIFSANNVFVGFWDPFASLSANNNLNFGLVDNVRVEVPAVLPEITSQPQPVWTTVNSNASFSVSASGLPTPVYQWLFNNSPITGATNFTLNVTNIQAGDAGNYSVIVTNIAGAVTSGNALLSIIPTQPAHFQLVSVTSGPSFHLVASGQTNATYVLETSTNLIDWTALTNLVATNGTFEFDAFPITSDARRFFRARSGP